MSNQQGAVTPPAPSSSIETEPMEKETPAPQTTASTLIEFPGKGRASLPPWRKELSERFREIQVRRAREAEDGIKRAIESPAPDSLAQPQLGLVPPPDAPALNPLVVAALRRIERAHQPTAPARTATRGSAYSGSAATAFARLPEEQYQSEARLEAALPVTSPITEEETAPLEAGSPSNAQSSMAATAMRERTLIVVPPKPLLPEEETAKPKPRRVVIPSTASESTSAPSVSAQTNSVSLTAPLEELYDDRAPIPARLMGGVIDLFVIAFASIPFAAIIELTNGNWEDQRVLAMLCGIIALLMFLYLTASTALTGRTWGMSLVHLRAVDVNTGEMPTNSQAVGRAILYMLSLVTFGLGILYALFDAERRTVHDHLSGTTVIRE